MPSLSLLQYLLPYLAPCFAALGFVLPGILKRDGFSERVNQIISFVVVALASALLAATQSKLGPNFFQDFAIVMTGMHVLLGVDGPFKTLDQFLQANVNAGSKPAPLAQFGWIPQSPQIQESDPEATMKLKVVNPQAMPAMPKNPIGG